MADEKSPSRISHRLFATSRSEMRIRMKKDIRIEKVTEELTQKSNTKEGGNENGKKKTTRGRKKSTTN